MGRSRPVLGLLGDDRLVDQVARGSHAAFEALYERHHRGMLAFCRHMLGSSHDAEEAVQQSFTAAYSDLSAGERPQALKPWLYGIARHRCLAVLRKRQTEADAEESPPGVSPALTEEVERRSELREMLAGVSRLPEPQRTALVLFGLCGHPQSDVASVLGCDVARVRALVYQARESLLEDRRARETPCHEIREKLALGRGGALRRRAVRRHVKFCPSCAEFRAEVLRQRRLTGLVAPVVPSAGLKAQVLAAAGLVGGAGAGGGSAGGLGGLVGTAKVVTAALVLTATPVGGEMLVNPPHDTPAPARAPHAPSRAQGAAAGSQLPGGSGSARQATPAARPVAGPPTRVRNPNAAGPPSPMPSEGAKDAGRSRGRGHGGGQGSERQLGGGPRDRAASARAARHERGTGSGRGHGGGGRSGGHSGHASRPGRGAPAESSPSADPPAQQPSGDSGPSKSCPVPPVSAGPVAVSSACPVET